MFADYDRSRFADGIARFTFAAAPSVIRMEGRKKAYPTTNKPIPNSPTDP
jgi:hypothetical protein